jgi:kinesin family protein 11
MEGERSADGSLSWEEDPLAGVIPRSLHELFEKIEAQQVTEFSIRVSFLELYNEELFDLLSQVDETGTKLRIFEDSARKGSVVIHGLEELQVHSKDEVYSILELGRARRQTAATLLNAQSSRSHSVFSVTVHIKENSIEGEELLKTGKLNLVDLAGSENISRSGAVDKRAREAGQINQSLLALGRVITALVERAPHVPYRESKLTRILQDSLGGRTKTSIIATVSPAMCNIEETLSTLDYAHRAKNITNRPEINQRLTKKALIKEYTDEIERLKKDLLATRDKNGIYISPENYAGMEALIRKQRESITELEAAIAANKDEVTKLNALFATSKTELEETARQLETTSQRLATTKVSLESTRQDLYQTSVEREQKSILLQEHVTTEQALLGQAGQLVGVVEDAIGDVDGLHSKLDRKTRVENTNTAATRNFQSTMEGEFEEMQQSLQEFSTTQTQFCQSMSQRIEEWSSEQQGCVQGIQEGLEGVVSLLRQFSHHQTSGGRQRTSHMQDSLTQSQSNVRQFQENLVSAADGVLTVTLAPFLAGLCSQLALQSSLLTQSTASLREQVSHHKLLLSEHCCMTDWSLSLSLSLFSCSPTVSWSLSLSVSRTRRSQN